MRTAKIFIARMRYISRMHVDESLVARARGAAAAIAPLIDQMRPRGGCRSRPSTRWSVRACSSCACRASTVARRLNPGDLPLTAAATTACQPAVISFAVVMIPITVVILGLSRIYERRAARST